MSSAGLVMRRRLPQRVEVRQRFFSLRWTMPYGIVKSFLNPHLYRERRVVGMVAER